MLGVGNDQLNNLSLEYLLETQQLERDLLELLHQYDQEQLTTEQRTSAGVYDWYLQDRVDAQPFMDNDYPISVSIFGLQNTLVQLFTDLHPLRNEQDGQDYLARLDQVPSEIRPGHRRTRTPGSCRRGAAQIPDAICYQRHSFDLCCIRNCHAFLYRFCGKVSRFGRS